MRKKKKEKKLPSKPATFFRMIFHMWFNYFFIKISWAQSIHVIEIMLSVRCHFFLKAIVFFELFKAISFSIFLTFRILAMKLIIFMNFFSLDLQTYNLNISRMWLINILLFSKKELFLTESRIPRMAVCAVKVGNI